MKKSFAVIGLGRFGSSVALTLAEHGQSVLAIDNDESRVKAIADQVPLSAVLDAMDEQALKDIGVKNVDTVIVSIGENIESSILVVMLLKDLGIKNIVAKAVNDLHGRVLEQLGVEKVVHPERDMAQRIANILFRPAFLEHIELTPNYSLAELAAPKFLWGKTLMESNLRANFGVNVIALYNPETKEKKVWNINPLPNDRIEKGDVLVCIGSNEKINELHKLSSES